MNFPLQYAYFTGAIISLIIWLILYLQRHDLRKKMIVMSMLVAILGLFSEYFWWTHDWWHPQTITGTVIGVEDLLLGFTNGGIAAVLYEYLFRKKTDQYKSSDRNVEVILIIACSFLVFIVTFYILKFNSFIATSITQVVTGGILVALRKDLLPNALSTGCFLTIISVPIYLLLEYLFPGFIENTYSWSDLSGIRFIKIPIEDLIFYFLTGFSIAPFYPYWKNEKLRKISS